jgi:hypothetical protein
MLDDVERRSLLVEPARKDPVEAPVRISHVELDEGPGQPLNLPGRARLAGPQPNHDVADPFRLAGLHLEVPRDAVALVEKADHRDSLRHRSRSRSDRGDGLVDVDGARLGLGLLVGGVGAFLPVAALQCDQAGSGETEAAIGRVHSCPGVQAW